MALLCPLALAVALWNGFPIIYYDTGAYLLEGLGRVFLPERSPAYSLFLDYAGARHSLWLIATLQALMTSFAMVETARALAPRLALRSMAAIALALMLLTGLPWFVGQIEPDCFAAVAVLSLYLLTFESAVLGRWRGLLLLVVAAVAIAVHTSHLLLAGLLLALTATYRMGAWVRAWLRNGATAARASDALPSGLRRLLQPCLACCLGLSLVIGSNHVLTGKYFVTRAGPAFLFARMLQDGLVMRVLDDECPQAHYRLCAYKDVLPRTTDQWLWNPGSPFVQLGRFGGSHAELSRIIREALRRYPLLQLEDAVLDTLQQFGSFRTGEQIVSQEWVLTGPFSKLIPAQLAAYQAARQQREAIDFAVVNLVQVPFGWLSVLGLGAALAAALRKRQANHAAFLAFILAALIGNAAICGALSNPHDRYQSRLIWLAPFALMLIAGDRANFALRGVRESGT